MNLGFLIDECLSAALAVSARRRGSLADYAPHLGAGRWPDWALANLALERDMALVTNNRRDFLKLYRRMELHSGLIVIIPSVTRDRQIRLFETVLDVLARRGEDLVNTLVEVTHDGQTHLRLWDAASADDEHMDRPRW